MPGKARRRRPAGLLRAISERLWSHIRERFDGKQAEFARRIDVRHPTLSGWLSPHSRAPDIGQLAAIAARGRVSLNWLIVGEGPELLGTSVPLQELTKELRATLVAELTARTGASAALVERVVPSAPALFNLLLDAHLPAIDEATTPVVAGISLVPLKKRGLNPDLQAGMKALNEMQIRRALAFVGRSALGSPKTQEPGRAAGARVTRG